MHVCVCAFALLQRYDTMHKLGVDDLVLSGGESVRMQHQSGSKADQEYLAAKAKGHTAAAHVVLAAECLQEWRLCLPPDWTGPLFPRMQKTRGAVGVKHVGYVWGAIGVSREEVNSFLKEATKALSLPHLTFHCMRVGGAVSLRVRGASIATIKELGDWASDAVLLYAFVTEEEMMEATAKMDGPTSERVTPLSVDEPGQRADKKRSRVLVDDDDSEEEQEEQRWLIPMGGSWTTREPEGGRKKGDSTEKMVLGGLGGLSWWSGGRRARVRDQKIDREAGVIEAVVGTYRVTLTFQKGSEEVLYRFKDSRGACHEGLPMTPTMKVETGQ